jgi:N-methylhydantoinase B
LRVWTSGGGGYGDPLERPAAAVHEDVLDGRVSSAAAERDYGVVVLADGSLDGAATEALRVRLRVERGDGPLPVVTRGVAHFEPER